MLITSSYPEKNFRFQIPHIYIHSIDYETTETSLAQNYFRDIIVDNRIIGKEYLTYINYNVQLVCIASKSGITKDLGGRLFNHVSFGASELFDEVGLGILRVRNVGGGDVQKMFPEASFSKSIGLSGTLTWTGQKVDLDVDILKRLKLRIRLAENKFS